MAGRELQQPVQIPDNTPLRLGLRARVDVAPTNNVQTGRSELSRVQTATLHWHAHRAHPRHTPHG
jgi:hypothetical protein